MKVLAFIKNLYSRIFEGNRKVQTLQEEVETLYYIINNCMDITAFPKATGVLRNTQLVDAEVLRIFSEICDKHKIPSYIVKP